MGKIVTILLFAVLLTACVNGQESLDGSGVSPDEKMRLNRDYGDLDTYQGCKALARRELNKAEQCAIEKLSQDCTPAADCLVTCISSPDGRKRGGGCYHICFSPPASHSWDARPDVDLEECDKLLDDSYSKQGVK